jgi:twitching motility protein PilT
MGIDSFINMAEDQGASDMHLEPGLPAAVRIRGSLRTIGEPIPPSVLRGMAHDLIGEAYWPQFIERRSFDLSRTLQGVRCRINILQSARGIGFAIRLLASSQATLERLNLHPSLKRFATHPHGLVLVCGPTGCGKSSTLAGLIQEVNLTEARHIVTIESPIEYAFRPKKAFIRQREVGRDTPSFSQALLDALREDPDVLMVGEMREPETLRLTLNAAETGHLVLSTVHSSSCAEALQRVVGAFPSEIQSSVAAQLADCLLGVIYQLETGAEYGMWTLERYRAWMQKRTKWVTTMPADESPDAVIVEGDQGTPLPPLRSSPSSGAEPQQASRGQAGAAPQSGTIEIEPVEGGLEGLIKELEKPE